MFDIGSSRYVGSGHHRSVDLVLHVGHAFVLIGEPRLRQRIVGRHMHERERAQLVVALRREDVHRAMVVELGGIAEIGDAGEHRAVVQMMAVDDVVRVGEVGAVLGRQKDGAERGDPAFRSLEVVRKVLLVVGRLHDGVVQHGAGNVDPPHRVGIDGLERIPVHREVGERRGRQIVGRRETLPRDIVIGLLTLPVTEADGTERGQRHDEHHERDPEHHAPRPALLPRPSGTGLLIGRLLSIRVASASSRSALGRLSGAVGGMLRGGRPVGARLRPCPHVGRGAPRRALLRRSPAWSRAGMLSVLGHVHLSG